MKPVYENLVTHKLSFEYDPQVSVMVGETDGSVEDFERWHDDNQRMASKDK